jgi:hypothetical protein
VNPSYKTHKSIRKRKKDKIVNQINKINEAKETSLFSFPPKGGTGVVVFVSFSCMVSIFLLKV